jgi:DNA invertase Pin-like site-specific DNA recombinase
MLVGYARVSSAGQSLDIQREHLTAAGCERIFEEKKSGRSAENRAALKEALRFAREGDTLIVSRLDRLARSAVDLHNMVAELRERGVGFRCIEQPLDTTGPYGELMFTILSGFAQFENDLRRDRQAEGIAKAKAEGRHMGRPQTVDAGAVRAALDAGERPAAIARRLGIGRASVYRVRDGAAPAH